MLKKPQYRTPCSTGKMAASQFQRTITIRQTVNMSDTENSMSGNHFLIAKTFTASNAAIITINRRMSTSLY